MERIKTLLADDHVIVLEGLKEVLSHQEEIEVIGQVVNGEEVLDFIKKNEVDVVVMDINMPVLDGLSCSKKLKQEYPDIKIIILTMYPQRSFTEEIIKLGIDGCLLKNNSGEELITAINRVMSGKNYYDLIKTFNSDQEEVVQYKLSEREIDIIRAMAEGLTSYEIADKLFISEHTVKTHRKNILRKTNFSNASQLIQFAVEQKLI